MIVIFYTIFEIQGRYGWEKSIGCVLFSLSAEVKLACPCRSSAVNSKKKDKSAIDLPDNFPFK
ncbi:MAG: hypothetical protein JGK17_17215 [Microcoleus sp. PH2017_10_PVI_O_A]|uniref:hypothetical protein n=1 Tax=unclassified Microcoleus TaxID=2642155 RepID=UPI001D9B86FF|nr:MULTISPECIES: hypothetical protein [unclassified Microcoleus]MCC3407296.1 hypothetical protein [Microcoleus sp. PH2017_10_PVI_O_A]MCC3463539.1 hypothetical protein [Microcoleus sp. PH2017_11_PCY_U_A]MCC3479827.1 hypothetical protein [Microcoleus sp. PH2017_12_PCY_D_A]MCC3528521.1 hypothetical protein [Microcoleus sp. PH2017_21_RUC_O_A]MCC3540697.1 hypothetical protein [Microcoleus sp. PH2017_22_RUC_O_B]